jgi:hypothetical protein
MDNDSAHISKEEFREYVHDVRKAQSLAAWSYTGLIIPLLGWILAGISLSLTKYVPDVGDLGERAQRVRSNARISITLSIIVAIIWGIFTYASVQDAKQQQAAQAEQQTAQQATQSQIQSCENAVRQKNAGIIAMDPYLINSVQSNEKEELNQCQNQSGINLTP